jgi:hypothetical protein
MAATESKPSAPGIFSKAKYLSFWGSRLGNEAASLKRNGIIALLTAWLLTLVWAPCMVIGFHEHHDIIAAIGILAIIGTVFGNIYGQILLTISNRRASATLGLKIGGRGGTYPPATPRLYEMWCQRRGLEPYGAITDRNPKSEM